MKSSITILIGMMVIATTSYIPTATVAQNDELTEREIAPDQKEKADSDDNTSLRGGLFGTEQSRPDPEEDELTPPDEEEGAQRFKGPIYDDHLR